MSDALDKAVSTEDLCKNDDLAVLRLETILNTLVENKVESLKQDNEKNHLSPKKNILQKIRFSSKSLICNNRNNNESTLKIENELMTKKKPKKERSLLKSKISLENNQFKKQVLRQETTSSAEEMTQNNDDNKICYCGEKSTSRRPSVSLNATENDYISIKIDDFELEESDIIIAQDELLRRVKNKKKRRRRRRRRKLKKRLILNPHLVDSFGQQQRELFKSFNNEHDDELPPRAKWTILATAFLLLFMCLLLVGITLRMAPLIDEMVREENEKLLNSISSSTNLSARELQQPQK